MGFIAFGGVGFVTKCAFGWKGIVEMLISYMDSMRLLAVICDGCGVNGGDSKN
jgi:hypothetical protein